MKRSFLFIKKSFLTLAIFALFFSNFSFLTSADDTLFSIEGMNMNNSVGGGGGGITAEQLQAILQSFQNGGTGGGVGGNGVYGGDGTTFNYAEREVVAQQATSGNSEEFKSALRTQIQTFQAGSYTNVEGVDLDNNGFEEIIATNGDDMLIYEWNGSTFRQSRFYGIDKLNKTHVYFLRLEDEAGDSIYYLIDYATGTINTEDGNFGRVKFQDTYINKLSQYGKILSGTNNFKFSHEDSCIQLLGEFSVACKYVTVDNNGLHLYTLTQKASTVNLTRSRRGGSSCRGWSGNMSIGSIVSGGIRCRIRSCEGSEGRGNPSVNGTLISRRGTNRFRLYMKGGTFGANETDYSGGGGNFGSQYRCNNTSRNFSIMQFLQGGNHNKDYGYMNGKFFMKNDDRVNEYYNYNGNSMKIGGFTVYRYTKVEDGSGGGSGSTFAVATSSEKKPYQSGSTIATSEYDRFVTKANSDGTYNYKITLEKPDGQDVIAFYGLNLNGIIFKDINGDGIKDIMTYEDYISEDNIKFKRIYEFIFDPSDYIYKQVLDGVDTLQYQWFDIDNDGDLDLLIRRYDQKLYLYRNNVLEDAFTNLGSVRGTYFLFKDVINNGKHQIITKNMPNNGVAGEWKIFNVDGDGYYNVTGSYENGLIGTDYKEYSIDSNTGSLMGILKEENKYKVVYYNTVTGLYENFPIEFYVQDLSSTYITNVNGTLVFLDKNGNYQSFYKESETGKYIQTEVYYLSNGITLRATTGAELGHEYRYGNGENDLYYIASDKADIQAKIAEGFDSNHIVITNVSDITNTFKDNTEFNGEVNSWDVEHITNLTGLFEGATSFNKSINAWNTSNVTNMSNMFKGATSFNQPLNNLSVSSLINITNMFNGATSFNQNLTNITFAGKTTHSWTGYDTGASSWTSANKPQLRTVMTKSNGVTKYITNTGMADGTYVINGTTYYIVSTKAQIQSYLLQGNYSKAPYIITTKVTDFSNLFYSGVTPSCSRQRINSPTRRTQNCNNQLNNNSNTRRNRMCIRANANYHNMFNGDIRSWDTSNVTTMENMFRQNHCFNQDISKWDTHNVTNMNYMFVSETFNNAFRQNISSWNVQKVGANHTGLRCNGCTWPAWSA